MTPKKIFYVRFCVHLCSWGSYSGGKAAGAWSWPLTSV